MKYLTQTQREQLLEQFDGIRQECNTITVRLFKNYHQPVPHEGHKDGATLENAKQSYDVVQGNMENIRVMLTAIERQHEKDSQDSGR